MPAVSKSPLPSANPRSFDLFVRSDGKRLYFTNPDHAITVSDGALAWTSNGMDRQEPFGNIASIHLQTAQIGNMSRVLDQCIVEFTDGVRLIVTNGAPNGLPDADKAPIYRDFVRDLHGRLAAGRYGSIRFSAGMAPWRYTGLKITLVIAGLLFVAAPAVLGLAFGDLKGLGLAVGGVFLGAPFVRMLLNNAPRDYTPDALPEQLLS
jgi:hypothetical protein